MEDWSEECLFYFTENADELGGEGEGGQHASENKMDSQK